jgi:CRP-like cAMP-binding protein
MTLEIQRAIHEHAFLHGLEPAQLDVLADIASETSFGENDVVLVDGEHSQAFYLITSGSVAVQLRSPGFVVCVQSLGPGQVFGWSSLLNDQDTLFQVRAREETRALRIAGADLKEACRKDSRLAAELLERTLQVVASRVKATEIRFAEMCGIRV